MDFFTRLFKNNFKNTLKRDSFFLYSSFSFFYFLLFLFFSIFQPVQAQGGTKVNRDLQFQIRKSIFVIKSVTQTMPRAPTIRSTVEPLNEQTNRSHLLFIEHTEFLFPLKFLRSRAE